MSNNPTGFSIKHLKGLKVLVDVIPRYIQSDLNFLF